jgi:hypothetical protein
MIFTMPVWRLTSGKSGRYPQNAMLLEYASPPWTWGVPGMKHTGRLYNPERAAVVSIMKKTAVKKVCKEFYEVVQHGFTLAISKDHS